MNQKKELVTKVSNIPIKLCLCEDGYLQCNPIKILHKLPPFNRSIQGMRVKAMSYAGKEVMLFEMNGKYHKTRGIVGCRYEQATISDSFKEACGKYRICNEHFKNINCKCFLKVDGDVLTLQIEALGLKINNCLKVIDENIAITQGFGRLARECVESQKKESENYLLFSGIVFQKIC